MIGLLARVAGAFSVMSREASKVPPNPGSDAGGEEAEGAVSASSDEVGSVLRITSRNYIAVTGNQVQAETIRLELD